MAKIFGNRWRIRNQIGQGGQAHVYLVDDLQDELAPPRVLKRVMNPKRHERFVREVEACKRLAHPNIIAILDHSALTSPIQDEDKMFLVMPWMEGGDLEKRAGIYKNALDTVLEMGAALAQALSHAHKSGVVHRDIKPANILYGGQNNAPVISDFGICLLRDAPRATDVAEVVGPRAFIAPELEDGGKLDAAPTADVYSLGKLLYFMLSGGIVVPRERHREQKFDIFAGRGVRHELFGRLLDRMICEHTTRIATMDEVAGEVQRIEQWDHQSTSAFSSGGKATLERLLQNERTALSVEEENARVRANEKAILERYSGSVTEWLRSELSTLTSNLTHAGISSAEVVDVATLQKLDERLAKFALDPHRRRIFGRLLHISGFSFSLGRDAFKAKHLLLFRGFTLYKPTVTFNRNVSKAESGELTVAFVPYYFKDETWQAFFSNEATKRGSFGTALNGRLVKSADDADLRHQTSAQKWPGDIADYKRVLDRAVEIFLDRMDSWSRSSMHGLE